MGAHPDAVKEARFIELLPEYNGNMRQAALAAGYSQRYVDTGFKLRIANSKFLSKLRLAYQGQITTLLPSIAKVESNVVQECLRDVNQVPKMAHTLKQIKQAAGVLGPDSVGVVQQTVNIKSIQALMVSVHTKPDDNENEIVDIQDDSLLPVSQGDSEDV